MEPSKDVAKVEEVVQPEVQATKEDVVEGNRDYAGAQAKTDPVEIRLVRKMDLRIMVGASS
jgi:hypothetical protein